MYAIVRAKGRQYKVEPGKVITTDKFDSAAGDKIELPEVLLIVSDDGNAQVGQPTVKGAVVRATVVETFRDKKVLVFKYKSKLGFRRHRGHRQTYTRLMIDSITL